MLIMNIIMNIIILINLTLIAGILPLIESKYLSLIQRRVGPTFVGYKGRLQFIADALKMFLKGCVTPNRVNDLFFFFLPACVLSICYLFWLNNYWGLNIIYFELEYNIVFLCILSLFMNMLIILTGISSVNKYSILSSISVTLLMFSLELLLGLLFLNIYLMNHSFNFSISFILQQEYSTLLIFFICYTIIIIVALLEMNRSPFDLAEAESELMAGFHVEYGAFFFGLFYLGEYFHLFFFSMMIIILFIGL